MRPGDGLDPSKLKGGDVSQYVQSGQEMKWMDFFLHIVPSNMFEAFAKGDILQVLFFLHFIRCRVNDVREKWTTGNRLFLKDYRKYFLTFYQL